MIERPVRSVSWLNEYVRDLFASDPKLSKVFIEGEISGGKLYPSGHYYFTLKDEQSQVSCVMFGMSKKGLDFRPTDGQRVIVDGQVTVYPPSGRYQVNVKMMRLAGKGKLYDQFLRLKESLLKEGLFDERHKKDIPRLPARIGVVTSEKGAVLSDIIHVLRQRQPGFSLLLYPVSVQGEPAAGEIARAIEVANRRADCDVLIVGRGGGSFEDLFAFNEEQVVRAIFASKIPVVAAVGHETDVTLTDFVADKRAPTPTAAAFMVSVDKAELLSAITSRKLSLGQMVQKRLEQNLSRLDRLKERPALADPSRFLEVRQQRIDLLRRRIDMVMPSCLERARTSSAGLKARLGRALPLRLERATAKWKHLTGRLNDLAPLRVLERGYAIVSDESGLVLSSTEGLVPGEKIGVRLFRGALDAKLTAIHASKKDDEKGKGSADRTFVTDPSDFA